MSSFPNFSNFQQFVRTALNNRKGKPEKISKLNPFVRLVSGGTKDGSVGLVLDSNPNTKLFQAAGTTYGSSTTSGVIGKTWSGGSVNAGTGQGYRPSPIVTSLEVDEASGALSRKATFSITCFTKEQMETISQYFLEPGFSIFIEWGWNTAAGVGGIVNPISASAIAKYQSSSNRNEKRKKSGGEYDNYLGFITGGSVAMDGDKWIITTNCTGYTELPTYLLTTETGEQKDGDIGVITTAEPFGLNYIGESKFLSDQRFMTMFNQLPQTRQTLAVKNLRTKFSADNSYLINFDEEVQEELNDETDGFTLFGVNLKKGKMTVGGNKVKFPAGTKITSSERFIRFDGLMDIIYEIGIAGYELPDGKVIKFELDYKDTLCSSFEQIYSTDSSKLFIPNSKTPKFNISAITAGSGKPLTTAELINPADSTVNNEVGGGGSNGKIRFPEKNKRTFTATNGTKITKESGQAGYLKNLYVNFDFAKKILETKKFYLKDAIYQILNGMSSAVNGMWNFQIEETECKQSDGSSLNTLKIWETNLITDGIQTPNYKFQMIGEKSIFIDASFDLDISGAKMNQVIGSKLASDRKLNTDNAPLLFQGGLTDKLGIKIKVKNVDNTTGSTTTDKDQQDLAETNLNIMLGKSHFYPKVNLQDSSNYSQDLFELCYLGAFHDSNIFSAFKSGNDELKKKKKASPLMPINFSFTIHGISGIRRGDMFKVNGIPTIYENGFFQVLSVKHTLEGMSWKTEVTGGYRNNK
jgi:hypothetical protein